jgi:Protein of unknown function (DUF4012)
MPSWRTRAARARYGQSTRRRRRARRRRLLLIPLFVVGAWLVASAVLLALAATDARAAEQRLRRLQDTTSGADLLRGEAGDELERAGDDLRAASRKANLLVVDPLRVLPFVGRQVTAFQSMLSASSGVVDAGVTALDDSKEQLGGDLPTGGARVELMGSIRGVLDQAQASVFRAASDKGPAKGLIQPLADAREELAERLGDITDQLSRAHLTVTALRSLLDGDGRYLVLAANNSEMQAGWGMPLQAGVLTVDDGEVSLPDLEATSDLILPVGVPFEGDLATNWGSLAPNREWRNLALTPRFVESAPLAARMWEARGGGPVDGVLAVDPYALKAILTATGPVTVEDGTTVSAESVVPFVLHDQYIDESIDEPGRAERQDRLSDVAAAAVDALGGSVDAATLVEELMQAAYHRHVLAWSAAPEEQAGWEASGIDGELDAQSTLVSLVNRGCNKLDWFVDVSARLEFAPTPQGREGTLRVTVDNRTPPGQSSYIAGPQPRCGVSAAGDWLGFLSVHLPGRVGNVTVEGAAAVVNGRDGPTRLVAANLLVPRGQQVESALRFQVPSDVVAVEVEPSGRARPLTWRVDDRRFGDDQHHTVELSDDNR